MLLSFASRGEFIALYRPSPGILSLLGDTTGRSIRPQHQLLGRRKSVQKAEQLASLTPAPWKLSAPLQSEVSRLAHPAKTTNASSHLGRGALA